MKKILYIVMIFVLLFTLISCDAEEASVTVEEKVISVEVQEPELGSLVNETTLVGKLQAKEEVMAMVQLAMPEEVVEVRYQVGDYVNENDIIIVLDSDSTDDQVENARLSYQTAATNYNAVLESVNTAKANLARTQALYDEGIVSKSQLESAQLQASDGQLRTLGTQLTQAKFAYDNAQKGIDNTTIVAPITGVISTLNFEVHNLASSQNSLTITDLSVLELNVQVTGDTLNMINDETTIEVVLESTGDILISSIETVNPVADQRTGLYDVLINVENSDMAFNPGMFARTTFKFTGEEIYIVPIDAILSDQDGAYVYTIVEEMPVRTPVTLGQDNGEIIEIKTGLDLDSLLVIKGQNYINEETPIKIVSGGN